MPGRTVPARPAACCSCWWMARTIRPSRRHWPDVAESRVQSLFDLHGQVALVTGAAGGLGRSISEVFARQGADLVLADREAAAVEAVAALCRGLGVRAQALAADLAQPAQVEALADHALSA